MKALSHPMPPLAATLAGLLVAGCGPAASASGGGAGNLPQTVSQVAYASMPASCHARPGPEPDSACTPGATDPRVTQANLGQTICRKGYTAGVRPPASFTEPIKLELMRRYHLAGSPSQYELDHLVSLELGGDPGAVLEDGHWLPTAGATLNLWPQAGASPNAKDDVENAANHLVCHGQMPLAEAQRKIASDWLAFSREPAMASEIAYQRSHQR